MLPKSLKSCPKLKKLPNLVTLTGTYISKEKNYAPEYFCKNINPDLNSNGPFQGTFFFIFVLSMKLTVNMFNIIFCQLLDLNCGPLELEATALTTEPQPLSYLSWPFILAWPKSLHSYFYIRHLKFLKVSNLNLL